MQMYPNSLYSLSAWFFFFFFSHVFDRRIMVRGWARRYLGPSGRTRRTSSPPSDPVRRQPLDTSTGSFPIPCRTPSREKSRCFGVQERVVRLRPVQEGNLIPQQQLACALMNGFCQDVGQVLDQIDIPDANRFYVSLASDRLRSASNAFFVTARKWRQDDLRAKTLIDNLSKMLNSNENVEMDDSFQLSVVHVQPPPHGTGRKRKYVPGHQSNVRLKQLKRSLVPMPRDEQGWCAAGAIVTAKALHLAGNDRHEWDGWIDRRRSYPRRQFAAKTLAREVGLGPGAWGPNELTKVAMVPSLRHYRIVVVNASQDYSVMAYGRGDQILALQYDEKHYYTLTTVTGFIGRNYLCPHCLKGCDHQSQHKCKRNKGVHCSSCLQMDCADRKEAFKNCRSSDVPYPKCHRHFFRAGCLTCHKTRTLDGKPICVIRQKCKDCKAYLRGQKRSGVTDAITRNVTRAKSMWTLPVINVSSKCPPTTQTIPNHRPFISFLTSRPCKWTPNTSQIS